MKNFNIFDVLSKDDKEIIHSSMIKFLLEEDDFFTQSLLNTPITSFKSILLEKKLDKHHRIDIFIELLNSIILIENKFKCLPSIAQLNQYTEKIRLLYPNTVVEKYLIYFEKGSNLQIPANWNVITYEFILDCCKSYLKNKNLTPDKKVFIEHYVESLESYVNFYKKLKKHGSGELEKVFLNKVKNSSFWLHLIFHEIAILFQGDDFETWVGAGMTYLPLLNVHNKKWKNSEREFLIQLNGTKLKYYAHFAENVDKQSIVDAEKSRLLKGGFQITSSGVFKNTIKKNSKTSFIYQEDIIEVLKSLNKDITIESIEYAIRELIDRIDKA
jgi:hypothetical protein